MKTMHLNPLPQQLVLQHVASSEQRLSYLQYMEFGKEMHSVWRRMEFARNDDLLTLAIFSSMDSRKE